MKVTLFRIAVLVLLLILCTFSVASAQVEDALPTELGDLLTPAGLGVVVMIAVGLLKRAGKFGTWITANRLNGFAVSLLVAGVILGVVYLIQYLGVYDIAQGFWLNFTIAWSVAQVAYNTQKAGAAGIKAVQGL